VEAVAIPFPEMNTALANGAVDAALATEPFVTQGAEQVAAIGFVEGFGIRAEHDHGGRLGADLGGIEDLWPAILVERLLPLATVMTPNIDEAAHLTGLTVTNPAEMRLAAEHLHEMGVRNVVVTGGHLEKAIDVLGFTTPSGVFEFEVFQSPRLATTSTHGTGCAFATALACHLAHGRSLPEAVLLTKAYVAAAIANAHPLGKGNGPVHHLYRMSEPSRQRVRETVASEHE